MATCVMMKCGGKVNGLDIINTFTTPRNGTPQNILVAHDVIIVDEIGYPICDIHVRYVEYTSKDDYRVEILIGKHELIIDRYNGDTVFRIDQQDVSPKWLIDKILDLVNH